jgi:hypothetical protein
LLQSIRLVLHIEQCEFPHGVTGLSLHSEGIHSEVVFQQRLDMLSVVVWIVGFIVPWYWRLTCCTDCSLYPSNEGS